MCGIVGAVADHDIVPILIDGLRRLEYRGYDSAGVAVLNGTGTIKRMRTVGKVRKLEDALVRNRFNQRATAAALGLSYDQLRHALKRHKLQDRAA